MDKKIKNEYLGIAVIILLSLGFLLGMSFPTNYDTDHDAMMHDMMTMVTDENVDEYRAMFVAQKEGMIGKLIMDGKYRCCLQRPCTYCIEKTPGHGEGATCDCLADVVNGKHPCGECIGEILEGHGNPYLAEYFAVAIAEEVGEKHLGTLHQIISEKYGIPIEEQDS